MTTTNDAADTLSPMKRALLELREMRARVDQAESAQAEPIAVVGLGLRFPGGANDPASYWRLLRDGIDAITPIPAERWNVDDFYDPDPTKPGTMYTRAGGFLDGVDLFSPQFWGIAPREAISMDPQQRLLLEVSWEALEHAGQAPDRLDGSPTGVFFGMGNSDYIRMLSRDPRNIDVYFATGNVLSVAAGRLSYLLGLRGPSMVVDTACSSSLVAVHLAVQSLRSGECAMALAGGVNLILSPEMNIDFSQAQMMARDGTCKTFDADADGYVRSEGCGVVVLKRLSDALANGDTVLALIRGSAVNQDGRSSGLTAPNGPSQESVIRAALANGRVRPDQVGYVEAHGTGTPLGDPIEVQAIGAALGAGRPEERPLLIGSAKTNIGHAEGAAGVAGLIKTILSLQHGEIPPHLHFSVPNPHIPWATLPIKVPRAVTPWQPIDGRRIAGVSSFGFSGTNAHVVIEEAPVHVAVAATAERPLHLLTLSAKTPTALATLVSAYGRHLENRPKQSLADMCFTANAGRAQLGERVAIVAASPEQLRARLVAALDDAEAVGVIRGRASNPEQPGVTFLFTGQGSQYTDMGRQLYETQPTYRAALDRCADLLRPHLDRPLIDVLYPERGELDGAANPIVDDMTYAQPALFALQYALAQLWRSWGIEPSMVDGHSIGEYAAACIAGVFSLEDGIKLVAARGRLLQAVAGGAMAVLFAEEARVAEALKPYEGAVSIAAINGPHSIVISGRSEAVRAVVSDLALTPDDWRPLGIPAASHSPLVEPILAEFEQVASEVRYRAPQIGLVSTLTGELASGADVTTPGYWRRHLRESVRFAQAMETLHRLGQTVFVEIGPHPTLLGMGRRCLPDDVGVWVPSLRKGADDWEQILEGVGELYAHGCDIDWIGFDRDYPRRRVSLPTYPWERQRYWADVTTHAEPTSPADDDAAWSVVVGASRRQAEQGPLDLNLASYRAKWRCLDRLATAYTVRTLRELGVFARPGEARTVDELIADYGIAPTYRKLLGRWLDQLVADGLLERRSGRVFSCPRPLPNPGLTTLEAEAERVLGDIRPLLDYVRRCGARLTAVVTGDDSPLETLFPEGSPETAEYLYRDWPVSRYFNLVAAATVGAIAAARPVGRALRVLEIGAGTGSTTSAMLPVLEGRPTVYQFTDVSEFFLGRAEERFKEYASVRYGVLNIEHDPSGQGYPAHGWDVVVAANALHATRDLDETLDHVRSLLAPGGFLVLYEATTHPHWFDVTTALIEGWQRFEDDARADVPLLPPVQWIEALRAHGFEHAHAFPEAGAAAEVLGQHVLVARVPVAAGDDDASRRGPDAADAATPYAVSADLLDSGHNPHDELTRRLADALPDERLDLLVEYVRGSVTRILRLDGAQPVHRDHRLMDLGVDSLMAVELRNRLGVGLGLARKLPATLIFDYPTVEAIAGFLDRQVLASDEPVSPSPNTVPVRRMAADQAPGPPTSATDIAALSDAEVEQLLLQRLT